MPGFSNAQLVLPGETEDIPSGVRLINPSSNCRMVYEREGIIIPFRLGEMDIKSDGRLNYQLNSGKYRTIDRVEAEERVINTPPREVARTFGSARNPLVATSDPTKKVLDILLRVTGNKSLREPANRIFDILDRGRVSERNKPALAHADSFAASNLPQFYGELGVGDSEKKILDGVSWLDEYPNYYRGWTLHALLNLVYRNKR